MKLVCLSDTHGLHGEVLVPHGEVLVHAGDWTSLGIGARMPDDFLSWFEAQPHAHKVLVAGNHDFVAEKYPEDFRRRVCRIPRTSYLCDSGATVAGIRFWGSPVTPTFRDWAFNRKRGPEIAGHWAMIPSDTQILVTHGPPQGVLDTTPIGDTKGCFNLLQRIAELPQLRIHIFGHMHGWGGKTTQFAGKQFANVALCSDEYRIARPPVVLEV